MTTRVQFVSARAFPLIAGVTTIELPITADAPRRLLTLANTGGADVSAVAYDVAPDGAVYGGAVYGGATALGALAHGAAREVRSEGDPAASVRLRVTAAAPGELTLALAGLPGDAGPYRLIVDGVPVAGADVGPTGAAGAAGAAGAPGPGRPAAPVGPFTNTAFLSGDGGAWLPTLAVGTTVAVSFFKVANATSEQVIAWSGDSYTTPSRGWYLGIDASGSFFLTLQGVGKVAVGAVGAFNALASGAPHALGISLHDLGGATHELHSSIDGGAVPAPVPANGTYLPPLPGDAFYIGCSHAADPFERPLAAADVYQFQTTSTEVSTAQLPALTATPTPLATVSTGTVAYDFNAATDFWPGDVNVKPRVGSGTLTINGGLGRRNHG